MSLHNKPEHNTPEIVAALKQHGLDVGTPSQLSDAFRLGWKAHLAAPLAVEDSRERCAAAPVPPQEAGGVEAPVATLLDVGFKYQNGTHTPTVLVGFPVNDWKARDAFARALLPAVQVPQTAGQPGDTPK